MFELPELPYKSLDKFLTEEQLKIHHGKHHKRYVDTLNNLLDTKYPELKQLDLGDIISEAHKIGCYSLYNNAAQHYNHSLFWHSMTPDGSKSELIENIIASQFGSMDNFKNLFKERAISLFGSGWVWLNNIGGKLFIGTTSNAEKPSSISREGVNIIPLMVLDVWEHAYYIDYKNERDKYVNKFFNHINWEFVERRFKNGT